MAMLALAIPIVPGKTDQWRRFIDQINGPRRAEYIDSRRHLGVRERVFLQSSPHGDLVLITVEGDDPETAFRFFGAQDDPFINWFREQVLELHGIDLAAPPPGPFPQLVVDSQEG
jgi:hypothetical protein